MKLITILSVMLFFAFPATAAQVPISSVWVIDGDTVKASLDGEQIKIRLANIDAPESKQAGGRASKWTLVNMIKRKKVSAVLSKKDRYGRWIGTLYVAGADLNSKMVATGHAWVYARYNDNPALPALQNRAKEHGLGLWGKPDPVAPWKWRRGQR